MEMEWDLILRLCVAGLCGTVIGLDREYRVKDAGFRTHFLVALGSALMMIVSQYGFEGFLATHDGLRLDPSRIAAQVVSGIGFIGAGTIIIHRQLVRGVFHIHVAAADGAFAIHRRSLRHAARAKKYLFHAFYLRTVFVLVFI